MPVVFQPADPVGEQIAAQYAATQQANQSAPLRAQMANQNANRDQANFLAQMQMDSANQRQSSENITRASIAGDELANRRYLQDQDIRGARQAQLAQIQARQQEIFLDAAMYEQKVTQSEVMRMQRQQVALDSIQQQVSSGMLKEDEAAEMKMQLLTGINMTQQRMQRDHARDYAAQAKIREEEAKTVALNNATFKAVQLKAAQMVGPDGQQTGTTGLIMNRATGTPHFVTIDDKGNIVELGKDGKAKEEEQKPKESNPWGHLAQKGTNKLDEQKVLKDAEAWARFNTPQVYKDEKQASGGTKRVLDKEETEKQVMDTARRRVEGIKREFAEAERGGPSAAPPQAAPQGPDPLQAITQVISAMPAEKQAKASPLMTEYRQVSSGPVTKESVARKAEIIQKLRELNR